MSTSARDHQLKLGCLSVSHPFPMSGKYEADAKSRRCAGTRNLAESLDRRALVQTERRTE